MAPSYVTPATFRFFTELARHNDRDWFAKNKERYHDEVRDPLLAFVTAFVAADLAPGVQEKIRRALLAAKEDPELLTALESKKGFVPIAPKPASTGWPGFRGPSRDGIVARLPDSLSAGTRVQANRTVEATVAAAEELDRIRQDGGLA